MHKRWLHRQCCVNITNYVQISPFFLMFSFSASKYILPPTEYIHPRTAIEAAGCWGAAPRLRPFSAKACGSLTRCGARVEFRTLAARILDGCSKEKRTRWNARSRESGGGSWRHPCHRTGSCGAVSQRTPLRSARCRHRPREVDRLRVQIALRIAAIEAGTCQGPDQAI